MRDAAMPESVHSGWLYAETPAKRLQYLPHNVVIFERRAIASLKNASSCPPTNMLREQLSCAGINMHISIAALCFG
jgi:hypothetical protein